MLRSVQGIYRNGKVELVDLPEGVQDESEVIVTFLDSNAVNLREHGIDLRQAAELRSRLSTFAEDWARPEMTLYDRYDSVKPNREAR